MLRLFQVCFFTGALYTLISFLLGHLLDFAGAGGEVHTDLGVDTDVDIDLNTDIGAHGAGGAAVSPLKPVTIAAFITVFGGAGILMLKNEHSIMAALMVAALLGLGVAFMLYRLLIVPLYRAQNTSAVSQASLVGSLAYATLSMEDNSFGRIKYTVEGNTYSAPCKSIDGKLITKGVPVVIIDIQKNIFYVKQVKGGSMQ
jgi:membrane protein implicated in regulation of membrane protease activity